MDSPLTPGFSAYDKGFFLLSDKARNHQQPMSCIFQSCSSKSERNSEALICLGKKQTLWVLTTNVVPNFASSCLCICKYIDSPWDPETEVMLVQNVDIIRWGHTLLLAAATFYCS